jgi:hypothetical protein
MKILIATSAVMAEDKYSWYTYKSLVPMHIPFKKSYNVLQSGQRFGLRSASTGDKTRMIFEGKPTLVMSLTPAETALLVERSNGKPLPRKQVAAQRASYDIGKKMRQEILDANPAMKEKVDQRALILKAKRLPTDFADLMKMCNEKGVTDSEIQFYKELSRKFRTMSTAKKPVTADAFVATVNDLIVAAQLNIKKSKVVKSASSIPAADITAISKAFRLKSKTLNDIKGILKGLAKGTFSMNPDKYQEISYDALEYSNTLDAIQMLGLPAFASREKDKGIRVALQSITSKYGDGVEIDNIHMTMPKALWNKTFGMYYDN